MSNKKAIENLFGLHTYEKKENKLHSIPISRTKWKLIVWSMIILGALIWSIFNYLVQKSLTGIDIFFLGLSAMGLCLVGFGFGLVYARIFKIEGIDDE